MALPRRGRRLVGAAGGSLGAYPRALQWVVLGAGTLEVQRHGRAHEVEGQRLVAPAPSMAHGARVFAGGPEFIPSFRSAGVRRREGSAL